MENTQKDIMREASRLIGMGHAGESLSLDTLIKENNKLQFSLEEKLKQYEGFGYGEDEEEKVLNEIDALGKRKTRARELLFNYLLLETLKDDNREWLQKVYNQIL